MNTVVENLRRIQENVDLLVGQGFSEADIEEYLSEEGYTGDQYLSASTKLDQIGNAEVPEAGFADRAGSSFLFNFGDELGALSDTSRIPKWAQANPLGWAALAAERTFFGGDPEKPTYEQQLAANRIGLDNYARTNPGKAITADVVGGLGAAVATAPFGGAPLALGRAGPQAIATARAATTAPQAAGWLQRSGQAARFGAVEGGVAGFGAGEGDAAEQLYSTVSGAGGGAVVGGVLPAGMTGASALKSRVFGRSEAATREAALDRFQEMLSSGKVSIDQVAARVKQLEDLGIDDTILADILGPNFRSDMNAASQLEDSTRVGIENFLQGRGARQGERVRDVLEEATGVRPITGDQSATRAAEWSAALADEANPLFNAALRPGGVPFDVGSDPILRQIAREPSARAAVNTVAEAKPFDYPGQGFFQNPLNPAQENLVMNTNFAENTRQAIGDAQKRAKNEDASLLSQTAGSVAGRFGQRLREMIPGYGTALDTRSAGYLADESQEAGYQFASATPRNRVATLRDLAERDAPREGLAPGLGPAFQNPSVERQFTQEGFMSQIGDLIRGRERPAGAAPDPSAGLDTMSGGGSRVDQVASAVSDMAKQDRMFAMFPNMRPEDGARMGQQLGALTEQSRTLNASKAGMQRRSIRSAYSPDINAGAASAIGGQGNFTPLLSQKAVELLEKGKKDAELEAFSKLSDVWTRAGSKQLNPFFDELAQRGAEIPRVGSAPRFAGAVTGAVVGGATGRAVGNKDDGVAMPRSEIDRGIEQRQRLLEGSTPEEAAKLRAQIDNLRRMIGGG